MWMQIQRPPEDIFESSRAKRDSERGEKGPLHDRQIRITIFIVMHQDRCKIELTIRPTQVAIKGCMRKGVLANTRNPFDDSLGIQLHMAALGTSLPPTAKQAYDEFSLKCLRYLKTKKEPQKGKEESEFHRMMDKVIDQYRLSERRGKECRSERGRYENKDRDSKREAEDKFKFEDKIELYKTIRSTQFENQLQFKKKGSKDYVKREVLGRPLTVRSSRSTLQARFSQPHPYFNINTIVCSALSIAPPVKHRSISTARPSSETTSGKKVQVLRPNPTKFIAMGNCENHDGHYMRKLKSFMDFIFKVNYSNGLYVNIELGTAEELHRYRVCVGKGNNSRLVKSLLERRFWLEIVDEDAKDINFYWTQLKLPKVFANQVSQFEQAEEKPLTRIARSQKKHQNHQINCKILSSYKATFVESLIFKDGYIVPFRHPYLPTVVTNHLPNNHAIGAKKNLFHSLFRYYTSTGKEPFQYIPKTYHIRSIDDPEWKLFLKTHADDPDRVWILKPGQNSNRGNGITLERSSSLAQKIRAKRKHDNGEVFTHIVQSYINRPFLYNGRKFDIRHYMLVTSVNGHMKAYWYKEGYIRTSSEPYDLEDLSNTYVHLTNDAIQKNSELYEQYEPANKLSYSEFQRYLDSNHSNKNYNLERDILHKMKEVLGDVMIANYLTIDPRRKESNFEIFGLDFMIDRDFNPYLIEINANPCLQVNCNLLNKIIPAMLENSFRIALDPLLPPRNHFPVNQRYNLSDHYLMNLKYQLFFESEGGKEGTVNEIEGEGEEEEFNDEGKEVGELLM